MKNSHLLLTVLPTVLLSVNLLANIGDPGFEKIASGDLPMWSGPYWAKHSQTKHTSKVINDQKQAHSGKQFLRVENPLSSTVAFVAYPVLKCVPGYAFKVTAWLRGTAKANIGLTPYDAKGKYKPWRQAHESGFRALNKDKWEPISFTYVPQKDEVTVMFTFGVRNGLADLDDYTIESVKTTTLGKDKK